MYYYYFKISIIWTKSSIYLVSLLVKKAILKYSFNQRISNKIIIGIKLYYFLCTRKNTRKYISYMEKDDKSMFDFRPNNVFYYYLLTEIINNAKTYKQ